jgi:hypothetical protein
VHRSSKQRGLPVVVREGTAFHVDHGTKGVNCSTWWANASSQVKRSIFLDELIYSVATDRVMVQRMGHLGEEIADIALE